MTISHSVETHAAHIAHEYKNITAMSKLEITPDNMSKFHRFLDLLSNEHGSEFATGVLAQPDIQQIKPGIQHLFSQASSLYERHWAQRLIKSEDSATLLRQEYPYFQHYERATGLEINAIYSLANETVKNVLMVGSGALPLTSLALLNADLVVENLDINQSDLMLGKAVSEALRPDKNMTFIHNDVCKQDQLQQYDVIWLAALVGDEKIKDQIIKHLFEHMRPGAQLVVRTAYNLRTLLYPSIDESGLLPFALKLKVQTYADNFHSILIAQKPV
ncbi:hypothetical protein PSECIP111951_00659 [Pseudoalteromonas holothuriae]|uniref:Nicotianamine synthase n=1 Tax=Pseudoalteromonas holothuriae TaxID=2963714 RepID=A0ABM9GED9_9GAMM|nr:nicotianamine synthase family protein [Pseudoalteromonas sp. CIP111951]CAH9052627.1 hypothetical protein PSECIP111951_00659 [Pseudoalteromonas sp. CIP111951]